MPVSYINCGATANDNTGTNLRDSFLIVNSNFSGLYNFTSSTANLSPTGIITPEYLGQEVYNVSGGFWFKAVNLSITGWANLNDTYPNIYSYQTAAGTQVTGVKTPRFIGDECLRTPENVWYKAVSMNITGWAALN